MRVREYVEALTPQDQQQLVNRLTLGLGWVSQAARLAQADGPCGAILAALTASLRFLVAVEQTVREGPLAVVVVGSVSGGMDRGDLHRLRWSDLVATRLPAEATALTADLTALAHQARELGRAVRADAETDHVHRHLAALIAALDALCHRLAAAVEP